MRASEPDIPPSRVGAPSEEAADVARPEGLALHDDASDRAASVGRGQVVEDLGRGEETFRLLVESVRDYAIFMLDPEGRVVTWNAGAQKIKGYAADEIIGKNFSIFYTAEAIERGWPQYELTVARAEGRFEDEGLRVRKDGTQFFANVVITALYSPNGELRGFAKVTRDVTQRKRLEEVAASAKEMTEFLAMLAHELRNPLAPIRNAVAIMELVETADPSMQWVQQVISRQVGHLTRLVDDLLDISRITRGRIALQLEPADLRTAVAHAIEVSQSLVHERNQRLEIHVPETPVMVRGDLTRLSQVASNLLSNAAKYTPENGRIMVSLECRDEIAVLRVKDTGIGMQHELISRAFDLFTQGERTLARSEGGLGVGLTLVRRLTEMHGGSVEAFSAGLGQGSEFVVRIPLLGSQTGALLPPASP